MSNHQAGTTRAPIGRVAELDLLRFVAASSVMVYHFTYRPRVNGVVLDTAFWPVQAASRFGYLGVTLFFMISGFVILWSSEARSAGEFFVSRIARLFPSFWICVLLTTLVVNAAGAEVVSLRTVALNLTMVPGVLGAPYVDGVYWTLFVELKFYVIIYAMLLTGAMARVETWLAVWLAASIVCAVGVRIPGLGSIALYPYGPYFISGCLFFLVRSRGVTKFRIGALAIACTLGATYAIKQQPNFMTGTTLASDFVVAASVVAFHIVFGVIALVPSILPASRWWYVLGGLTYPLYLLHNRIGKVIWAQLSTTQPLWVAVAIEATVVMAVSAIIAALVERRACGKLHRALLQTAVRFRVVRPSSA